MLKRRREVACVLHSVHLATRMYFNAYVLVVNTISTVRWSDRDKLPVYFNTYILVTHIYFNTYVLIAYRISTVRAERQR